MQIAIKLAEHTSKCVIEVKVIVELKDAVKQGKIISYLSGELNKPEEKKPDAKAVQLAEKKPEQKPEKLLN